MFENLHDLGCNIKIRVGILISANSKKVNLKGIRIAWKLQ